ncbi:glycoside hydrolase family 18 protein [Mycena rosella]|uniref:Glycoside hydrolase family 18 protein n=1 Tax=Mycena rosella TaxID=1033263 RepID=A0AAD7GG69_MYCRO|nr:glycoside hydrolase family 18 protein [Mycena rosella]
MPRSISLDLYPLNSTFQSSSMLPVVKNAGHTTASAPRPHIVYKFEVDRDGLVDVVQKRYSEFVALHAALGISDFELPPKRLLVTTFIPSAWLDDALIAERKAGLGEYLTKLLTSPHYRHSEVVQEFLALSITASPVEFELEDAVPSILSRKTVEELISATANFISAAYYPSWTADGFPPEKFDYSKFDILFFAFAIPNTSSTLTWDAPTQAMLKRLVASAKKSGHGTKIVLSVGGWTGSAAFHQIAGSSANRSKFVSTLSSVVSKFGLDGIDIDWEYPNQAGAGNPFGPADSANFLSLLKALRMSLGPSKIISAAVTDLPWLGSNGSPLTDVSAYAAQLSYVNLMNYDINGGWSAAPGPNAPLGNLCGNSSQPAYSAQAAFKQWTAAKFPASKLLLGLPLYGYVFKSTKTALASFALPENGEEAEAAPDPDADIEDEVPADDLEVNDTLHGANKRPAYMESPEAEAAELESEVSTEAVANLGKWWGQAIPFNSLVASGALVKNPDGTYGAGPGFKRAWDDCSDTPFLYNTAQKTVVSYDDTSSLEQKAAFAKLKGMAGCFTWSSDQDDGVTLQKAIRKGLGKL